MPLRSVIRLQSGIPYGTAFVKNAYVGRTFIKPKQSSRESSVRVKLNYCVKQWTANALIMIDDSIVRGTTSDRIVKCCGMPERRRCMSASVHRRFYGRAISVPILPAREQLIAYNRTVEKIRQVIGADSLGYLDCSRLRQMAGTCRSAPDVLPETIRWIRRWRISEENSNSRYRRKI